MVIWLHIFFFFDVSARYEITVVFFKKSEIARITFFGFIGYVFSTVVFGKQVSCFFFFFSARDAKKQPGKIHWKQKNSQYSEVIV